MRSHDNPEYKIYALCLYMLILGLIIYLLSSCSHTVREPVEGDYRLIEEKVCLYGEVRYTHEENSPDYLIEMRECGEYVPICHVQIYLGIAQGGWTEVTSMPGSKCVDLKPPFEIGTWKKFDLRPTQTSPITSK